MSNPYQLVVFDWEGTVSDTLGLILHVVASEADALGFGNLDPYLARKYVDLGIVQAMKKLFPHLTAAEHEQLLHTVQHALVSRPAEVFLIPGAREFIEQLVVANIDIAIATNKGQHSLQRALQATGLDSLFKVTRSACQAPAKPCPQMLEEIIEVFGQNTSSTLMIGDSATDMEMANNIQVAAIGVDFYHQNEHSLKNAGALAVFDDYQQIAHFLQLPKK